MTESNYSSKMKPPQGMLGAKRSTEREYSSNMTEREYLPDSIYSLCGEYTQDCSVCSNVVYSDQINNYVHDTQRGKVFCPFGKGETLNKNIYNDQVAIINPRTWGQSTWGNVPQLDPRPLSKIGLEWRTS